jgi:hypothetical protein
MVAGNLCHPASDAGAVRAQVPPDAEDLCQLSAAFMPKPVVNLRNYARGAFNAPEATPYFG